MNDSSSLPFVAAKKSRLEWWYRLAAPAWSREPKTHAERLRSSRARLLATIGLLVLVVIGMLIPATLFIPNRYTLWLCLMLMLVCLLCLLLNRAGKVLAACSLLVVSVETAIGLVIWSTRPFDTFNLPLYDIFIVGELLAVSLLPASSVFGVLLLNALFIGLSLSFQPHTLPLMVLLRTQYYNSLARPLVVQVVVAVITYLWVRSNEHANLRADQAETIARLEHDLLAHTQDVAQQKERLEQDIQSLVAMHNQAIRGQLQPTLSQIQSPILFPLHTAFSLLYARLHRAYQVEHGHATLLQAIEEVGQAVRSARPIKPTHTALDTLLLTLQQKNAAKGRQTLPLERRSTHQKGSDTL